MMPAAICGASLALLVSAATAQYPLPAGLPTTEAELVALRARLRAYMDSLHAENEYRWHEAVPGESVRFGYPGTEAEAIRIECRDRQIDLIWYAETNEDLGYTVGVIFGNGEQRTATVIELVESDAPFYRVEMAPGDPLLSWILRQSRIEIRGTSMDEALIDVWIPTAGGVEMLQSLVRNCRG